MSQAEIDRGRKVEVWLQDPEFNRTFQLLEADLIEKFRQCSVRDTEGLQLINLQLGLLQQFRKLFEQTAQAGRVEAYNLDMQRQ